MCHIYVLNKNDTSIIIQISHNWAVYSDHPTILSHLTPGLSNWTIWLLQPPSVLCNACITPSNIYTSINTGGKVCNYYCYYYWHSLHCHLPSCAKAPTLNHLLLNCLSDLSDWPGKYTCFSGVIGRKVVVKGGLSGCILAEWPCQCSPEVR